jgi:hypothetical protein
MLVRQNVEKAQVRLMHGLEAMRAIGWDLTDYLDTPCQGDAASANELLKNLAGNAFSGYQVGPILAAMTAARGLDDDDEAIEVHPEEVPEHMSSDSES